MIFAQQQTEEKNMNAKQLTAPIIAIMMVAAVFVTMAAAFTAPNANDDRVEFEYSESNCDGLYVNERTCDDAGELLTTLRIYGEANISAAFPYDDPEGPFDPTNSESPEKDFVVFNPAYIEAHDKVDEIKRNKRPGSANANEKIFVRQWYVPEYEEPTGRTWTHQDPVTSPDIVTEYSFMLLDMSNKPTYGYANITRLYLPIGSIDSQIGLESFVPVRGTTKEEIVEIVDIGDFDSDGLKDIDIRTYNDITVKRQQTIEFLDHAMKVNEVYADERVAVSIYYLGNDDQWHQRTLTVNVGDVIVAGRGDVNVNTDPDFYNPWYIQITGIQHVSHKAIVKVGRLLHMGETFFVDGAEYDIAMIYGPEPNDQTFETFKYITIRNPLPKCDVEVNPDCDCVELPELSIYKEVVLRCNVLPMLPPFNTLHTMIDDINCNCTACPEEKCDNMLDDTSSVSDRMVFDVDALDIHWMEEDIEPRFHTNLLEILKEPEEIWQWIHIHIMPEAYTEMAYPELPDATPECEDSGDFLLVSSWEAPNSCGDRMKFAHDAEDSSDIYVNEHNVPECGNNSVRIYGEANISAAFPYNDPEGPFNKLSEDAPRKDFVTFNPAYIAAHDLDDEIKRHVNGQGSSANANEKIFVRQWYVPEYEEPTGWTWTHQDPVTSPDIVTEYTYMLLDTSNMPTYGYANITRLYLPIGSIDSPPIGLDSFVPVRYTDKDEIVEIVDIGDFDGDGLKDIDVRTYNEITVNRKQTIEFLDHAMKVHEVYADERVAVEIFYLGNDDQWHMKNLTVDVGDVIVAGRGDVNVNTDPDKYDPWYIEITGIQHVSHKAIVKVGRLLHMGETFFVDGAEYDIAMIYGPDNENEFTTFKYITIRNPLPKCDVEHGCVDVELPELSIFKERVDVCDLLPILPPFNMEHKIVDDIGIPHTCPGPFGDVIQDEPIGIDECADTVAKRIVTGQPEFKSYYAEEDTEWRFRTNLLEILDEDADPEDWDMLCMWTLPWAYTAMVYPNVGDMTNCGPIKDADFIVTTSGPAETESEPDCNPWDDPSSDDGERITVSEIMAAITLWNNQEPPATGCSVVTVTDIMDLIITWTNQ